MGNTPTPKPQDSPAPLTEFTVSLFTSSGGEPYRSHGHFTTGSMQLKLSLEVVVGLIPESYNVGEAEVAVCDGQAECGPGHDLYYLFESWT